MKRWYCALVAILCLAALGVFTDTASGQGFGRQLTYSYHPRSRNAAYHPRSLYGYGTYAPRPCASAMAPLPYPTVVDHFHYHILLPTPGYAPW